MLSTLNHIHEGPIPHILLLKSLIFSNMFYLKNLKLVSPLTNYV